MSAPTTTSTLYAGYQVLDAAYRAELARLSLTVARAMFIYWREVDYRDLRRTSTRWLDRSVDAVMTQQGRATTLADAYTARVRALSLPGAPTFTPPNPRPPNAEQIRTSLEFTGIKTTARELYSLQRSTQLTPEATPEEVASAQRTLEGRAQQLMDDGVKRAAGAGTRLITLAGRDQLEDNVIADKAALGWYRTTKAGCCYFCAMLASRGLVYKEDSFEFSNELFEGAGEQKVHDYCGCGLRPAYRNDEELPDRTAELEKLWIASGKTKRPDESAINAFRRTYDASPLAQRVE